MIAYSDHCFYNVLFKVKTLHCFVNCFFLIFTHKHSLTRQNYIQQGSEIKTCSVFKWSKVFFLWSPLVRRHRFWPPSMIYISVIIITHISHITNHAGMVNSCSVSEQFRFQILSARQDRFFGPRNIHLGPLGLLSVGDFLIEWLSPGLMGDSFNFTSIWLHTKLCYFCTSTIG